MCLEMCSDMCLDMCVGMCVGMYLDMPSGAAALRLLVSRHASDDGARRRAQALVLIRRHRVHAVVRRCTYIGIADGMSSDRVQARASTPF